MHGPGKLPVPLSTFVGREAEIAELVSLVGQARLVSVTGLGGSGKSRLALAVARRLASSFPDGVRWVSLAPVIEPPDLVRAVADALQPLRGDRRADVAALRERLATSQALLIFDSCEHVSDAAAELIEDLLATCANLRVIATSQRRLGVAGEVTWALPPLSGPTGVRLFADRARNAVARFDLDDDTTAIVTEVCRRLEGIPLAIELAAARIKVLSVQQIEARLDDALGLLVGGTRTAVPRHHSLRATLDRSFELLGESERRLLAELSSFPGSFDLDAVERMQPVPGSGEPLDVLTELVDRSLVTVIPSGQNVQYRLPEPVRQYAQGRVEAPAPRKAVRRFSDLWAAGQAAPRTAAIEADPGELRVQALGMACVHRGATLVEASAWTYAKPRELLYYLLSHANSTKEQIGAALWPSTHPSKLRNSFHTTLHHLRRALGDPAWISYRQGRYAFNRSWAFDYDVDVLEAGLARIQSSDGASLPFLVAAVEAYQGDFLADLAGEDWIDARRTELRTAYERVLLALGRRYAHTGQFAQAVQTYARAIKHDNLLEVAHRELIHTYARMGERARALHHYNNLVTLLHDQLGIQPSTETRILYAAVRDGEAVAPPSFSASPSVSPSG